MEEAAHSLDGVVKIGKIDAKLIPNLKIEKNPTYMFTRSDSPQKSAPFEGTLNSKDIAKFCLEQLSGFVKSRLGDKSSGSSNSGSSSKGGSKSESQSRGSSSSSSQSSKASSSVIELNDKAF